MTPSDYEMVEQGYDPPRMTPTLEDENRALREALRELRDYAASVWFDEATATDEERELMDRTRRALAAEALAAEPASEEGGDVIDVGKTGDDLGPGVDAATGAALKDKP